MKIPKMLCEMSVVSEESYWENSEWRYWESSEWRENIVSEETDKEENRS